MERESLEYRIVVEDGPDTEVFARLTSLDIAGAALLAAIARHPQRNVQFRHGARIVKRHDDEPKPEPPRDPNLRRWSAHLVGGKKMQLLGYVEPRTRQGPSRPQPRRSTSTTPGAAGWR